MFTSHGVLKSKFYSDLVPQTYGAALEDNAASGDSKAADNPALCWIKLNQPCKKQLDVKSFTNFGNQNEADKFQDPRISQHRWFADKFDETSSDAWDGTVSSCLERKKYYEKYCQLDDPPFPHWKITPEAGMDALHSPVLSVSKPKHNSGKDNNNSGKANNNSISIPFVASIILNIILFVLILFFRKH